MSSRMSATTCHHVCDGCHRAAYPALCLASSASGRRVGRCAVCGQLAEGRVVDAVKRGQIAARALRSSGVRRAAIGLGLGCPCSECDVNGATLPAAGSSLPPPA